MEPQEKKNKRKGLIVSTGVHLGLLLIFALLLAWREPNPPLPEYGIELNFGISNVGSGDIQPETNPNTEEAVEDSESQPEEVEEAEVEEVETPTEEQVEEVIEEADETVEEIPTEESDSPDVVEEKEEQTKEEVVEEKKEPVKETVEEKKETEKPVEEVVEENKDTANDGKEENSESDEKASSHGDNVDKEGDKGDDEGDLDARALYGKKGGGGGSSLDMTGWMWDFVPKPNDTSDESGRVVFEIKIDDQGEIISVRTVERSVSPTVERIYKQEVLKLTFSKTSDNTRPAPISTGKITFIVKAN